MHNVFAFFIFLYGWLKKCVIWSTKPQNLSLIIARLQLLSKAAKFFGSATKYQAFNDVANGSVSIAKTLSTIVDGQTKEAAEVFIENVNRSNSGQLKKLGVGIDKEKGISVNFKGITGSYNPKDGSASVGYKL